MSCKNITCATYQFPVIHTPARTTALHLQPKKKGETNSSGAEYGFMQFPSRNACRTHSTNIIDNYIRDKIPLGKPIIPQIIKIFPVFYGTSMFIIVFTRERRWTLI
jgi:hypothetical protein